MAGEWNIHLIPLLEHRYQNKYMYCTIRSDCSQNILVFRHFFREIVLCHFLSNLSLSHLEEEEEERYIMHQEF